MNPLKIVMVASCPFPANHGTPAAIRELALELVKQGHEVHVVTYPDFQPGIDVEGLIIHRVKSPFKHSGEIKIGPSKDRLLYDFLMVPKLIKVVKQYKIDIIHAHNYEAAIAGGLARFFTWCPLAYNGINSMADELPTYGALKPKSLFRALGGLLDFIVPRLANVSLVLSDELKAYLVNNIKLSEQRVLVIPPGVNPHDFAGGDGLLAKQRLGLDVDTPTIVYTGAIESFQRVDLLIESMGNVAKQHASAELIIVGNIRNDDAKLALQSRADQLGFADRLHFVDEVPFSELKHYLDMADVTVSPRVSCPGYPIKLLNYMAAGKAIVCFEGSAKGLCHGYNAYVAKDENIDDFAAGILELLGDPSLREILGLRATETIVGNFDWDSIARGCVNIFRQIIENGSVDAKQLKGLVKKSYIPTLSSVDHSKFPCEGSLTFPEY